MRKHDVCVQNQDLLTNFSKDFRKAYEEVVKIWGDDIFITDDAYWLNGTLDSDLCALRRKEGAIVDTDKLFDLIFNTKVKHGLIPSLL